MQLDFTLAPSSESIDWLTQNINDEPGTFSQAYPFAFFMRDGPKALVAGCNGSVIFGSIYTDQLWVAKDYRRRGLGKQLMEAVHTYGKSLGCLFATVNSMSFQHTRAFYESLGYSLEYERSGYAGGASCLFFKKYL